MRRSVFKREVKFIVQKNSLTDGDEDKLLDALFSGIKSDVSEQYLLKDTILTERDINSALNGFLDQVRADITQIFIISSDLQLPKGLLESLDQKEKVALFIGAGVSKLIGIPLWNELAIQAIEYLFQKEHISYVESDRLRRESSPRSILSILHQTLDKESLKGFYTYAFKPNSHKLNPYDCIAKVKIPKISLNLDEELWKSMCSQSTSLHSSTEEEIEKVELKFPQRECEYFDKNTPIEKNRLYQIHGSINTLDKHCIVTMENYLQSYYGSDIGLNEFLQKLSHEYKLIFLGCGMDEMELLGPIVGGGKRHIVTAGTFIGEKRYFEIQREYYEKNLKMEVHGFYLDFNGYDRLYMLIKSWMEKIDFEMRRDFYSKLGDIDGVIL